MSSGRGCRHRRHTLSLAGWGILGFRLDAVSARADAEAIAQTGRQAAAGSFRRRLSLFLVCFADAAEGSQALFHRGVAHASGIERAVQVVGEAAVSMAACLSFLIGGWLWFLGFGVFFSLFGLFLGWVEIDAAELVSL
jgi:hypothetical protein